MESTRTLVVIFALTGWLATIVATLAKRELPDPTLLGIPAGLWLAIRPWPSRHPETTPPPPNEETEQ